MTSKKPIILGLALVGAAFFTATQPITPEMALVSSITVVLFAIPSYRAVLVTHGKRYGFVILVALGIYALLIESSAIHTGFPYGNFVYTDVLGNKVFGVTPWTVAFAYPPILLAAYWFVRTVRRFKTWQIYVYTAVTAMVIDLVLDPAAVALGFWYWDQPGFFYNVPLVNFLGWLLSGFIGAILLHKLWGKAARPTPALAYSGMAIVWFWTSVNIWLTQWLPAAIGIAITIILFRTMKQKQVY